MKKVTPQEAERAALSEVVAGRHRMISLSEGASNEFKRSLRLFAQSTRRGRFLGTNGGAPELQTAPLDVILTTGFAHLSEDQAATLLAGCRQRCKEQGDGRYCVLSEIFNEISTWRDEHNEHGGVPYRLLVDIGNTIAAQLPAVFSASLPVGTQLAATLRQEVASRLLSPQEWRDWV